jgi:hypothetical protein
MRVRHAFAGQGATFAGGFGTAILGLEGFAHCFGCVEADPHDGVDGMLRVIGRKAFRGPAPGRWRQLEVLRFCVDLGGAPAAGVRGPL